MTRPMYWNYYGFNRRRRRRYSFCAVITPHTQQQTQRRTNMTINELLQHYKIKLPDLWFQLNTNTCHWIQVGQLFLLYVKKKYNHKRGRWELELISLTPSQYTHTQNHRFAKPILSISMY